jgi:Ca-activated chloride channel homolog
MALDGDLAVDVFDAESAPTRGLGTIWAGPAAARRPLPLASVAIAAKVADRIAAVTVTQVFRNTFADPIEAVYTFPLDGGCVVSGFEMRVGERTLRGLVRERDSARQDYERALQEGRRAALLEQERDDVFTIQLGNLPAGEDATIRLTYSEELTFFDNGLTALRLPLVLGVRYIAGEPLPGTSAGHGTELDTNVVPDGSRLTPPRLVEGFDPQVHLSIRVEIDGGPLADLTCSQHATRFGAAGGRTTVSLARADERLNRDFVLRWRVAPARGIEPRLFFHRDPTGARFGIVSIGVSAAPAQARPRDVIFVLDRSGSMEGPKMSSAARACSLLLNTLGPTDRFGLLAFNEGIHWLTGSGGADGLTTADRTGIARGEGLLRDVRANGGTELHAALHEALDALRGSGDAAGRVPVVVVVTDGEVGDESRALELVQRAAARVFTVGVDTSVNSGLLKRLAQAGRGTFVLTEPGGALDDALAAIAREIGAPLVEDLSLSLEGSAVSHLAPERLPDLFPGRAVTMAFRADTGSTLRLTGRHADGSVFSQEVRGADLDLPAIAHLWARRRLTDLEDRHRLAHGDKADLEAEIVAVSTSHGVLSRFTAFVIVDDRQAVVSTADRRTIVQPVEMPNLWASRPSIAASLISQQMDEAFRIGNRAVLAMDAHGPASASRPSLPMGSTLFRRHAQTPGAPMTDPSAPREIGEDMERLLRILHDTGASPGVRQRCEEALAIVARLLQRLGTIGGSRDVSPLTSALQTLRDRLGAALTAEQELEGAATQLTSLWATLSPRVARRGRFWENV